MWSLNLNILQLFGCFIVDVPTTKLIDYMREPLELFRRRRLNFWSITCHGQIFMYSPSKYPETLNWNLQGSLWYFWEQFERIICEKRKYHKLAVKPELVIPSVNSVLKGKNSLRYFGSVIWNSLPTEIREDHSILSFVTKIKQWKPIACPCTICKSYIGRVGYIKVSDY